LLCATAAILTNAKTAADRTRLFWAFTGLGLGMWFSVQLLWTYFEVFLGRSAPNPFVGDVILFLHVVPMMAAVAVQPHLRQDDRAIRVDTLDFILLCTWWLFLYLFVVIPWQYVCPANSTYGVSFDILYTCEQLVLGVGLIRVWYLSSGVWRGIYREFFGAALLGCAGSLVTNEAIHLHLYYTGSLFDVPQVAAMAWFVRIGLLAREATTRSRPEDVAGRGHGIWTARLAMLAVSLTPLMMVWAQFGGSVPQRVRSYRLLLTVAVMMVMGFLIILKQHLLDQELLSLLRLTRHNLKEMRRMKDELEGNEQSLRWHSLELQRKNLELQEISFTDSLTGTWNRRYIEEIIPAEAEQVLRNYQRARGGDLRKMDHRDLVFLMVDMDFFKEVNDEHGHLAGDRMLQLVAERLATVVRKADVLVRWGGEEFLIMSRSADPAGTPAFCSRILEVMSATPFDLGHGVSVSKSCSVGWAAFPWYRGAFEALRAEDSIALADAALYRAKALGRNVGVGIVPGDGAVRNPQAITLKSVQEINSRLSRIVLTQCPALDTASEVRLEAAQPAKKLDV
jgi:diguanylate cyclase (GGDEF)-like protein